MRRYFGMLPLALLAFGLSSCNQNGGVSIPESGASLEGTVKFGNEPIPYAQIIAITASGQGSGKIDPETGRYKIDNVPIGEVTIGVNTDAGMGDYQILVRQGGAGGTDNKGVKRGMAKAPVAVPKKYQDPTTSGIKTTTQKGSNTFDIVVPK